MKYLTLNENANLSCSLVGYITANFEELQTLFGNPSMGDGFKTDAEWVVTFEDRSYLSIYNYKDGVNYNGEEGTPTDEITDWHLGGVNKDAIPHLEKLLKELRDSF